MTNTIINKEVNVTRLGFKKDLRAYPRQVEYEGHTYDFIDAGISCMIRSGGRIIQTLTLTDGQTQFRLRGNERGSKWTLLSISA